MSSEPAANASIEASEPSPASKMNATERKAAGGLMLIYVSRMLGLFMVLPVLSAYGIHLTDATPALLGLALGIYGLMQAMLQVPFGMASDRFGRKPLITIGLLIFILGSVVAANADSIAFLIVGRALQGAGAVAAAVLALAADLTREEQRTKMMAILGVSIGLAFVVSLVLGPLLASKWGLEGVFWITAGLGIIALLSLYFLVPKPMLLTHHLDAQGHRDQLKDVLKDTGLIKLDLGIFLLHAMMTACFVILPLSLIDAGMEADRHWLIYLPAVGIACAILVPLMGLADGKRLGREVFLLCVAALGVVQFGFGWLHSSTQLMLGIGLFFGFFSVLEAMLPSLVSKVAPAGAKGTAMGVYSSCQFLGAFVGGALGGLLFEQYGAQTVFISAALTCIVWLVLTWSIRMPSRTSVLMVKSTARDEAAERIKLELSSKCGVLDTYFDGDAGIFHLKIDKDLADADGLRALCRSS